MEPSCAEIQDEKRIRELALGTLLEHYTFGGMFGLTRLTTTELVRVLKVCEHMRSRLYRRRTGKDIATKNLFLAKYRKKYSVLKDGDVIIRRALERLGLDKKVK